MKVNSRKKTCGLFREILLPQNFVAIRYVTAARPCTINVHVYCLYFVHVIGFILCYLWLL